MAEDDVFDMSIESMKKWAKMSDEEWSEHIKGYPTLCQVMSYSGSGDEKDPEISEDYFLKEEEPEYIRQRNLKKIIDINRSNIMKLVPPPKPQRPSRKCCLIKKKKNSIKKEYKSKSNFKNNLLLALVEEARLEQAKIKLERLKKEQENVKYLYAFTCAVEVMKQQCSDRAKEQDLINNEKINTNSILENNIITTTDMKEYSPIIKLKHNQNMKLKSTKKTVKFDMKETLNPENYNTPKNVTKHKKPKNSIKNKENYPQVDGRTLIQCDTVSQEKYKEYVAQHTLDQVVKREMIVSSLEEEGMEVQVPGCSTSEEYIVHTSDTEQDTSMKHRTVIKQNGFERVPLCIKNSLFSDSSDSEPGNNVGDPVRNVKQRSIRF